MVRKDLLLFFSDRRSVILSFVVPIAIASFFGSIFSGSSTSEPARIAVAVVDQDNSTISKAIIAGAQADKNLTLTTPSEQDARAAVKGGKLSVAVIIPKGLAKRRAKRSSGSERSRRSAFSMIRRAAPSWRW